MAQPQKPLPASGETVRARRSQLFNTILPGTIVRRRGDGKLAEVLSTAAWPSTWITVRLRDTGAVVKLRGASAFTIPAIETAGAARKRTKSQASGHFDARGVAVLHIDEKRQRLDHDDEESEDPTSPLESPTHLEPSVAVYEDDAAAPLTPPCSTRARPLRVPTAHDAIVHASQESAIHSLHSLVAAASMVASPRHPICRMSHPPASDSEAAVASSLLFLGNSL